MFSPGDQVEYLEGDRWLQGEVFAVFPNSVTIVPRTQFQQLIGRPLDQVRKV